MITLKDFGDDRIGIRRRNAMLLFYFFGYLMGLIFGSRFDHIGGFFHDFRGEHPEYHEQPGTTTKNRP